MPLWLEDLLKKAGGAVTGLGSLAKDFVWDSSTNSPKWQNITTLATAYGVSRADDSETLQDLTGIGKVPLPTGYTGGIPEYTYKRTLVPNAFTSYERDNEGLMSLDAEESKIARRPGSAGRRYFTDGKFVPVAEGGAEGGAEENEDNSGLTDSVCPLGTLKSGDLIPAGSSAEEYCNLIDAGSLADPSTTITAMGKFDDTVNSTTGETVLLDDDFITTTEGMGSEYTNLASGGLASLKSRGYYLGGRTDGMADRVPATIDQKQPARLSDGEFVVPADVVSHLGNGSSNAGADQLFNMMDRVRKARTGRKSQGKEINPQRYLG